MWTAIFNESVPGAIWRFIRQYLVPAFPDSAPGRLVRLVMRGLRYLREAGRRCVPALKTLYGWWLCSVAYTLPRRFYHALRRAAAGSAVLRAAFGPSRLDGIYTESRAAGLLRWLINAAAAAGRALVRLAEGSVILRALGNGIRRVRPLRWLLRYETLFGLFVCLMFVVNHWDWNNMYGVFAAVFLLVYYLLLCAAGKRELVYPDVLGPGLALFALSCLLSMLFVLPKNLENSFVILLLFLSSFVICWLIAVSFDNARSLRSLLGFMYLSLLLVSAYGVIQRLLGLVSVNNAYSYWLINQGVPGRVFSTLYNPNNLSYFIQLFLPLGAAYAAGAEKKRRRAVLGLLLIVPAVAMVMTYARAGWISVILAAAVFVWCCNKKLLPVFIILLVLALPLMPQSVLIRLSTITDSRDTSAIHRWDIWKGVLALLGDRGYWLTGVGLGPYTFLDFYDDYSYGIARSGAYHSQMLYMELDLELGIVGFLSFLWMMLKQSGRAGRDLAHPGGRNNRLILIAVIAVVAGTAVSALVEYQWFYQRCIFAFFIYLGIAFAAMRISEREDAPPLETDQSLESE